MIITKKKGHFIINDEQFSLDGTVVSYRNDARVEAFATKELARNEHRNRFPNRYDDGGLRVSMMKPTLTRPKDKT